MFSVEIVKKSLVAALISSLFGCANIATAPVKNQIMPVSNLSVTYAFPNSVNESDLIFHEFQERTDYAQGVFENHGVRVKRLPQEYLVTHYVDNGAAGSINQYRVKVLASGNTITLTPFENRKHQDGLILPKPIPNFSQKDIVDFLSATRHKFTFEIDSKFPSESVNANFKRIASRQFSKQFTATSSGEKIFENSYALDLAEATVKFDVTTYPYQNGSKCTVNVSYFTKSNSAGAIDIKIIENKIKERISSIVNA